MNLSNLILQMAAIQAQAQAQGQQGGTQNQSNQQNLQQNPLQSLLTRQLNQGGGLGTGLSGKNVSPWVTMAVITGALVAAHIMMTQAMGSPTTNQTTPAGPIQNKTTQRAPIKPKPMFNDPDGIMIEQPETKEDPTLWKGGDKNPKPINLDELQSALGANTPNQVGPLTQTLNNTLETGNHQGQTHSKSLRAAWDITSGQTSLASAGKTVGAAVEKTLLETQKLLG
jgi:hypothetical protein